MLEDLRIIIAPTGAGKTVRLVVRLIRRATGPVVTTSTKPDVLRLTAGIRMQRFPKSRVIVFDPEEMTSWPDTVRWDIVAGCQDGSVAMERAKAIVAARPLTGDSTNSGFFSQAVTIVLQCMLHAAAVGVYTMRDVMTWMNDFSNETPYNVLSDHPAAIHAWQALLVKYCRGKADETVSSMDMSASGILNAFAVEKILDAVCPGPGHMLDLGAFHTSTDTLYLLCKGESSPVASVFTALVESLLSSASDAATRSVTGYLDPPLNAVLDEAANVCPIPSLPTRMSAGRGEGVITTVVIQDRPQLEQRYAKSAGTILNNATEIIALGGLTDVPLLKDLSDLAGDVETRQRGTAQTREKRALSVGEIRTVKDGDAVLFYRTMKPAILTLRAWWQTAERQEYEDALEWAAEQEAPIRDRRNAGALT
nr:TraM recognition domain-containing protein [Plantibacter sp. CFBP 8775]